MPIAIKIKNFKVRSLDLDFNEVSWTIDNTLVDILDYSFQVVRSESPEGPFMVLSEPFYDKYLFIDNAILIGDKWRTYYYRLRVSNVRTGESMETESASKEPEPDLYALEIRRHIQVLFREHAGRRMWLLPNRQTGQRCECWAPRLAQRTRSGCKTCFPPGTLIRTEIGWRPIETIRVGERVLSSDGTFQRVTEVMERQYTGDVHEILSTVSAVPVLATSEHPFLVLRGSHKRKIGCSPKCNGYIAAGDGDVERNPNVRRLPGGRWRARVQLQGSNRISLGTFDARIDAENAIRDHRKKHHVPGHVLVWDAANNISHKDWLVAGWPKEIEVVEHIRVPEQFLQKTTRAAPRLGRTEFKVDCEFLWMIGLYLAEGSSGTRQIIFSLHEQEIEYQTRLVEFFQSYGYSPSIRKNSDHGVSVIISSTTLAQWFPCWLGKRCDSKSIPEELMHLPLEQTRAIIQGILDGDGHEKYQEITQTSYILALQLVELLHRLGEQPLMRTQVSKALTPNGNKRKIAYVVGWARETASNANRKGRWAFQDKLLTQVKSVRSTAYEGPVYNLEVEGNHTYIANGLVVHNCFDTGYVRGYYYPIETFGQIDPSAKASQTTNVGPMQQTNTTGRFPAYPPIKPDDILVELENRRWKVTKVTCTEKARAAVHQEVELHEIPPSDIEYAIPLVLEQATKDLWATPLRNYVNPHNLENLQGWDNIFDLFRQR